MSTIDELMYAKNPSYRDKLLMYEELIGLSKGEQREAYKQEYVDTITKYGSCTSLSFALTPCRFVKHVGQCRNEGTHEARASEGVA